MAGFGRFAGRIFSRMKGFCLAFCLVAGAAGRQQQAWNEAKHEADADREPSQDVDEQPRQEAVESLEDVGDLDLFAATLLVEQAHVPDDQRAAQQPDGAAIR